MSRGQVAVVGAGTMGHGIAYAAALRFWSYPILIILGIGVWRSSRRRLQDERRSFS